ncbi:tRNA(His) guanylyltransferase Thg1 family protein [Desulforhabdus amnigena]|jgi:tRNA(His) 5'-end guanylyltransferase|uniref:tRNA(His) guanylyltransferase n=1 Tax=Desulforhabdus amnigena TaxID=40218 RepID=A0A9W6FRV0_9BACT|nr:tRNA(His) guanylyltransferase Thg1 family protein [Desulforhabdus amnigena]NLJ28892.1 tRNA 5'-guanylyltransferase [Deltaproteobacteria bacterium]GLI33917.1 guanylyltransferase [Desulforhabdus amnigena]
MELKDLEKRMRSLEYFSSLRMLPACWPIIRLDGRGFSRKTSDRFSKPFDPQFRDLMVSAASALLTELQGVYAYTMSDEISLLLPRDWVLFDRRLEKVVSVSAGIVSAAFSLALGEAAHFDSRIWMGPDAMLVLDYFRWRQAEAANNALHSWCYWTLRKMGKSVAEATQLLKSESASYQNEFLFRHGINFNNLPRWQRRGVGLYWECFKKEGTDPRTGKTTLATRRRIKIDRELPMKDEYGQMLFEIMAAYSDV